MKRGDAVLYDTGDADRENPWVKATVVRIDNRNSTATIRREDRGTTDIVALRFLKLGDEVPS